MLTRMCKKFGILGALAIAVGILGAPYFRNFGSPKIQKNGSAPCAQTGEAKIPVARGHSMEYTNISYLAQATSSFFYVLI